MEKVACTVERIVVELDCPPIWIQHLDPPGIAPACVARNGDGELSKPADLPNRVVQPSPTSKAVEEAVSLESDVIDRPGAMAAAANTPASV